MRGIVEPALRQRALVVLAFVLLLAGGLARQQRRALGHRLHLGALAVAVERHVDAGREGRLGAGPERAPKRAHREVVGHQQTVEADRAADHPLDHRGGLRRGPLRVDGPEDHVGAHRHRQVGERPEGHEILCLQRGEIGLDNRQAVVAVAGRAAVAGNVLHHGQHAAGHQPVGHRAADLGHRRRRGAVGAVADDVVGAGYRNVEHRRAIDVDADILEVVRHQPGAEPGERGRRPVEARVGPARRVGRPVRRAHPLHPAALLVDQDRRVGPADRVAERGGQRAHLVGRADVALEQDEAPGPHVPEEGGLLRREGPAGAAEDQGTGGHRDGLARGGRDRIGIRGRGGSAGGTPPARRKRGSPRPRAMPPGGCCVPDSEERPSAR